MNDRFQALRIIVIALAGGQLAFLAVAVAVQRSVVPPESLDQTTLPVVAAVVLLSAIAASFQLSRILIGKASSQTDEASKWKSYQTATIVRMALPEGASFLNVAFYLVTGEWIFLTLFVGSFGAFLFQRPSEDEWHRVRSGSA